MTCCDFSYQVHRLPHVKFPGFVNFLSIFLSDQIAFAFLGQIVHSDNFLSNDWSERKFKTEIESKS